MSDNTNPDPYAPPETIDEVQAEYFPGKEYAVKFGTFFIADGFGFHHRGILRLNDDFLVVHGRMTLPIWKRYPLAIIIAVALGTIIGPLSILVAAVVLFILSNKKKLVALGRQDAQVISQRGRTLRFRSEDLKSGKLRTATIVFSSVDEACEVQRYLS